MPQVPNILLLSSYLSTILSHDIPTAYILIKITNKSYPVSEYVCQLAKAYADNFMKGDEKYSWVYHDGLEEKLTSFCGPGTKNGDKNQVISY